MIIHSIVQSIRRLTLGGIKPSPFLEKLENLAEMAGGYCGRGSTVSMWWNFGTGCRRMTTWMLTYVVIRLFHSRAGWLYLVLSVPCLGIYAGCAGPDPIEQPPTPAYTIQVVSGRPLYVVRLRTLLIANGFPNSVSQNDDKTEIFMRDGQPFAAVPLPPLYSVKLGAVARTNSSAPLTIQKLQLIAAGRYKNWQWKILADQTLASPSRNFVQQTAEGRTGAAPAAVSWRARLETMWNGMLQRLYQEDAYITGGPLPPLNATFVLVPEGVNYRFSYTQNSRGGIPLLVYLSFPRNGAQSDTIGSRYQQVALTAQAILQTTLYGVAESFNGSGGVANGQSASLQNQLNLACWVNATTYGDAAQHSGEAIPSGPANVADPETLTHMVIFWRRMRTYYPDNWVVQYIYAEKLLDQESGNYLKHSPESMVRNSSGAGSESVSDLARFCRVLFHQSPTVSREARSGLLADATEVNPPQATVRWR